MPAEALTADASKPSRQWYLYLIETAKGALYTGITTDVARRFAQHQQGKGARALRGKGPLRLLHAERVGEHGDALRREAQIKRMRAGEKRQWLRQRRRLVDTDDGVLDCHDIVTQT